MPDVCSVRDCLQVRVSPWSWGAVPLSNSRHAGWAGLHTLLCWLPTVSWPSADINTHQRNPTLIHEKCYRMLSYPSTFYNVWVGFAMTVHWKGADAFHQREKSPRAPTIKLGNTGYNPPVLQNIPFLELGKKCRNLSYCVLVAIKEIFHLLLTCLF